MSSELVDAIRRDILTGELKPRERLVETALAQKYQVSRTPVREAIKQLEALGLVKLERYKGAVVADVDSTEVREMLFVRAGLEGMAAALAAARFTDEGLAQMRQHLDEMAQAAQARNIELFSIANEAFHTLTYIESGNHFLTELMHDILNRTWHERAASWHSIGDVERNMAEHQRIYQALEAHDPELACREAEQHAINAILLQDERRRQREEAAAFSLRNALID